MVRKCANPDCEARFLYFGRGQLFVARRRTHHDSDPQEPAMIPEFFWICENCASRMSLQFDFDGAPMIVHKDPAEYDDYYPLSANVESQEAAFI